VDLLAARKGELRNTCKALVGKPKSNRPLGKSKRRWEGVMV